MKSKFVAGTLAGALALSACLFIEQARAVTVYTYTGNNYNAISTPTTPPAGAYDTTMSVTGSFTLLNPLAGNLSGADITADVIGFSFSDGRNTITNLNGTGLFVFFSTDLAGNITGWSVRLDQGSTAAVGDQSWLIATNATGVDSDFAQILECIAPLIDGGCTVGEDFASIREAPGSWSVSQTPGVVPLPAALPLFAGGIGALGLLGWRRKRKANAATT